MMNIFRLRANADPFRYERKFVISELNKYEVESIIKRHPACFSEIFHQRTVNNIYFDSQDMVNYLDNECGASQRIKVRIRWYERLFGMIEKPVLELKIKGGQLGNKISFPLLPFKLGCRVFFNSVKDVFRRSDIPETVREELMAMQVTLLNSYSRMYFQSADRKYRLTLDWGMKHYTIDNVHNTFKKKKDDYLNTVLEVKYSDDNDDNAHAITDYFPFSLSRNSKYMVGIDNLSGLR